MLSVSKIGAGASASAVANYHEKEGEKATKEDYYSAEKAGVWKGEMARELGIEGKQIEKGELLASMQGYNPETGEALAKNAGEAHKAGWDCTFSAPKSVSMAWAFGDEKTRQALEAAHSKSVERALAYTQNDTRAFTNKDRAGENAGAAADKILVATYQHGASREGDPQLHSHCIVMNMTQRADGTTAALDMDMRWKMAMGAAYRAELSAELQKQGYQIERDKDSFRIADVSKEHEAEFSKRREQIEKSLKESGHYGAAAASVAALSTRKAKELTPEQLEASWKQAAKEIDWKNPSTDPQHQSVPEPMPTHAELLDKLTVQASTVTEQQLQAEVFREAQGKMSLEEAKSYLADLKASPEIVHLESSKPSMLQRGTTHDQENRYTSREMWQLEKNMGEQAVRMAGERGHQVKDTSLQAATASRTLSDEQKTALKHITQDSGRIAVVQGTAGAGKSYMLDAAREAWERDGYTVRGAALAGKAAEGLEKASAIPSQTLHSLAFELQQGKTTLDAKTVIVIDEAGMVGSRQMAELIDRADQAGAKVVLVGDTRQLQPIDAGGAMRSIQERVGRTEMNEIRRQQTEEGRQMVQDLAAGRSDKALEALDKAGCIREYQNRDQVRQGAAKELVNDLKEGKSAILLAETRAEVHKINQLAREDAKAAGLVKGSDKPFQTERGERQFAVGDRVIFLKNDRQLGVKNGTTGTVEKAQEGRITIKTDDGKTVKVNELGYRDIDHGYAMTVHKSQGVTVDRAHFVPGQMSHRELAYVAASRHRESVHIHTTTDAKKDLQQSFEKSQSKGTSQDYKAKEHLTDKQKEDHGKNQQVREKSPRVQRDAELATKALEAHKRGEKALDGKKLDKAIKEGKAHIEKDSKGRSYVVNHKGGKVQCRDLSKQVRETKTGLTTRYIKTDKTLKVAGIDTRIKTGTQILKSQGYTARMASNIKKDINQDKKPSSWIKSPIRQVANKALTKAEGWERAGRIESIGARIKMAVEERQAKNEVLKDLKEQAAKVAPEKKEAGKEMDRVEKAKEINREIDKIGKEPEHHKPNQEHKHDGERETESAKEPAPTPAREPEREAERER
ncbi:MobF family relaxase [Sulfuricella sp.]|uniref:MobF family relaxase n=1 Tax=Sulfuricella sp. TaxID=2099377 RepID=UPI002C1B634D|nr:MobF family relaxase [Sulfuricella sp.]HUX64331.1 MobF family relaxase [Sulfuricella sp.]